MIKRLILAVAFLTGIGIDLAAARYVRKQQEPAFFSPGSARQQPERLPIPRYSAGEEETIKQVEPEREIRQYKIDMKASQIIDTVSEPVTPEEETETPDYQHKFDDYSRDLEQINSQGQIPDNQVLRDDLNQMNSEQRIVVNHRAYQPRNSKAKFNRALQNSLEND